MVDFTNTIIICTSNIGSEIIQQSLTALAARQKSYEELKKELMDILHQHLRPEFLNRLDEIIVFHALTREQIREIVGLQLERVRRMAQAQEIELRFDESLMAHLAETGYQPEFGARELKRQIRAELETELASALLRSDIKPGDMVRMFFDSQAGNVCHLGSPRFRTHCGSRQCRPRRPPLLLSE
ncbi:MAG: hypothetical protein Fur0021_20960 [Candidatus Promineifilaceae bacterium]